MHSLRRRTDRDALFARLQHLRPDTPRRWGRMTAPQMICHLTDAYRNLLRERPVSSPARAPTLFGRTLLKWVALYAPVAWPHGLKTHPAADQLIGGTPPSAEFAGDVQSLESVTARFLDALEKGMLPTHYLFGELSKQQWGRWAYRHMDHHLRQFGL